jgi:hypothetical protein
MQEDMDATDTTSTSPNYQVPKQEEQNYIYAVPQKNKMFVEIHTC